MAVGVLAGCGVALSVGFSLLAGLGLVDGALVGVAGLLLAGLGLVDGLLTAAVVALLAGLLWAWLGLADGVLVESRAAFNAAGAGGSGRVPQHVAEAAKPLLPDAPQAHPAMTAPSVEHGTLSALASTQMTVEA